LRASAISLADPGDSAQPAIMIAVGTAPFGWSLPR
jgi:hypothetical protein